MVLGPVDVVLHDQQVARKTHLLDHAQLVLGPCQDLPASPLAHVAHVGQHVRLLAQLAVEPGELQDQAFFVLGRFDLQPLQVGAVERGVHPVGVALEEPLEGQLAQVLVLVAPLGQRVARDAVGHPLAHRQLDVAHRGDLGAVAEDLVGPVGERLLHLLGRLDVELVAGELPAVLVGQRRLRLDGQQHFVGAGVLLFDVVAVVGGHHAQPVLLRELAQHRVDLLLLLQAVVLDLDEVAVAEDLQVLVQPLLGQVDPVRQDELGNLRPQAARKRDDALVVLAQNLAVDARLHVETLEVGPAREPHQVLVAHEVLGQQGQVKVAAVEALAHRAVEAALGGHVGLVADDGLDPRGRGLLVELHRPEEVPVVRGRERRIVGRGLLDPLDQLVQLGRAVEQRELGVLVQVGELHGVSLPARGAERMTAPRPAQEPARDRTRRSARERACCDSRK